VPFTTEVIDVITEFVILA